MQAGPLRKRVTIQKRVQSLDDFGNQSNTWTYVCELWASVVPMGGAEVLAGGAIRARSLFTVTTRYFPGIEPKMRLIYEGQIFDIMNINDTDQRHRELVMSCSAGLNDG